MARVATARPVGFVRVAWLLLPVVNAPLVLVNVIKDKLPVCPAFLARTNRHRVIGCVTNARKTLKVNSPMPVVVHCVFWAKNPSLAVRNAPCARRVKRALASMARVTHAKPVNIAQAVWMPQHVNIAPWVISAAVQVIQVAFHVFLVHLVTKLGWSASAHRVPKILLPRAVLKRGVWHAQRAKEILASLLRVVNVWLEKEKMFPPKNVLNVVLAHFKQNQGKCFVKHAPLVLVKAIPGKRRVCNAVPGNSMMVRVPFVAHHVWIRRILVAKAEIPLASIVQLGGLPKTGVWNAKRVVRGRLALSVPIVQWVMPEAVTTRMLHNANNANWVKQRQLKVQRLATRVTLVNLAVVVASVLNAPLGFIKTTKVKITASNATGANRLSMLKPPAVTVTKVNMAVTMALVLPAQLVIFKIPKVKQSAEKIVSPLEKYPTTKAPDVNCHRGVPAKWANI
jgi:hypothetical protein